MPWRARLRVVTIVFGCVAGVLGLGGGAALAHGAARGGLATAALAALAFGLYVGYTRIPGLALLRPIPWRGRPGRGQVAISFDDGPNEPYTAEILDCFARHGAKGTFFLLGHAVEQHPATARRIAAEGHAVGSHTYNHVKLHWCSPARIAQEIDRGEAALAAAGVTTSRIFRAPHGAKNPFLPYLLRRRGLRLIAWTFGVWDTDRPGAEVIARRALAKLEDGCILLLHDGQPGRDRSQTVAALEVVLQGCDRRGWRCVTIPELLDSRVA
jgi:peptidoglycan-N-acetylglucosamine deacetylase